MRILIIISFSILLSSCFEVVEEISLKNNGSGSFKHKFNFSQSKSQINSAIKLDSFFGTKIPSVNEIKLYIQKIKNSYINSKGISNIILKEDYTNYIIEFSGNFDNMQNLMTATDKAVLIIDPNAGAGSKYYKYQNSDSFFNREIYSSFNEKTLKRINKISGNNNTGTYTMIIRNEKEAKKVNNAKAKISPTKKAVLVKLTLGEVIANPKLLTIKITY